jgi:hypothetical protein
LSATLSRADRASTLARWCLPRRHTEGFRHARSEEAKGLLDEVAGWKQQLLLTFVAFASEAMAQDVQCVPERAAMVETIRADARLEVDVLGLQGISERVLEAVGKTERHRFISKRSCSFAYTDAPVLIGHGQTISQPFIVALMTHLAAPVLGRSYRIAQDRAGAASEFPEQSGRRISQNDPTRARADGDCTVEPEVLSHRTRRSYCSAPRFRLQRNGSNFLAELPRAPIRAGRSSLRSRGSAPPRTEGGSTIQTL